MQPEYCIAWDENSGRNVLKNLTLPPQSYLFIKSVYAQQYLFSSNYKKSLPDKLEDKYLIDLLQEERTDIGQKIEALDKLNSFNDEKLKKYILTSSYKEPILLTLLDLSRHTDKELAYKANNLISNRFKIDNYLLEELLSDSESRNEATKILFRIEKIRALKILQNIPNNISYSWLKKLKKEIKLGNKTRVLIPTGSSKGDRYYVKAEWDPENRNVVNCLTNLFYRELIHDRTLKEEADLMKRKNGKRWVYWYSKEWALYIFEKIETCSAKAFFVGIRY